jgi:predicted dehydrogenase
MAERTIRFGILGPGKIARKFSADLQRVAGASLHAVASSSLERAVAFANEFNIPHVFGSYQDMMDCPDLDVVYVATPHAFHYEHTMLCLRHNLNVLCEKPFALDRAHAQEMIDMARSKQLFLMEALWTLFIPAFVDAIRQVESGVIGDIHSIKADFGFYSPYNPSSRLYNPALGGGSILDIGLYPALLFQNVLGKPPLAGVKVVANLTRDNVDASCFFSYQYPDNRMAMGHSTVQGNTPTEATCLPGFTIPKVIRSSILRMVAQRNINSLMKAGVISLKRHMW